MSSSEIVVRPLATPAEIDAFFRLAASTFMRNVPEENAGRDLCRYHAGAPDADPGNARAAFRDGALLGGYLVEERWLRLGSARVRTGWIGSVVTHPHHRRQGVATALMRDAVAYAHDRHLVLLLLHGLADFYTPFGYIDVFDAMEHTIGRNRVLSLPHGPYRVRPATVEDASALLSHYQCHYGPYTGATDRSQTRQEHYLRFVASLKPGVYRQRDGLPFAPPTLAVDATGQPRGYLASAWGPLRAFGYEAAAEDWPAALALLQHHSQQLEVAPEPPADVVWALPPDSPTFYLLADHLPVSSRAYHQPHAGWSACPTDLSALVQVMLPVWGDRWRRYGFDPGVLTLMVGDETWGLELARNDVRLFALRPDEAPNVRLSPQVFVQLLFGHRPSRWAAQQPGQVVPRDLVSVLDALFPPGGAWIAPTDGC